MIVLKFSGTVAHQPSQQQNAARLGQWLRLAPLLLSLGSACSTSLPQGDLLYKDPHGAVSLRRITDRDFKADHPTALTSPLIASMLSGVLVQEQQRALQTVLAGSPSLVPVFSREEIGFLAPRLSSALATASTNQVVEFRLTNLHQATSAMESDTTETTAGFLYVQGPILGLCLTQYRSIPTRPPELTIGNPTSRLVVDKSGLSGRTLLFRPTQALRSDMPMNPGLGESPQRFLAVDYKVLAQAPHALDSPVKERVASPSREPSAGTPAPPQAPRTMEPSPARDAEITALKDLVIKKELELERLRTEIESLKKQLAH